MVEGENVLHHIKKEGGIAGRGKCPGACPAEYVQGRASSCGSVGMWVCRSHKVVHYTRSNFYKTC